MDLKYWSVQVICFLFDNRYTIDRREFLIGSEQLVFYFFEKFETVLFSFETGFYLFENNGKKNVHLQLTFMSSTSKTRVELGGMHPGTPLAPYPISWKWKTKTKLIDLDILAHRKVNEKQTKSIDLDILAHWKLLKWLFTGKPYMLTSTCDKKNSSNLTITLSLIWACFNCGSRK